MTVEFMRFTIDEANAGDAADWTFASGWYAFAGSAWAWYVREASDG